MRYRWMNGHMCVRVHVRLKHAKGREASQGVVGGGLNPVQGKGAGWSTSLTTADRSV
jgi:hypothetical protein